MPTKRVKAPAAKRTEPARQIFVYIGPTIRGVIAHGKMFTGTRKEAEEAAQSAIERQPLVKTLMVPCETLAEDRQKLKTPGTYLYQAYRAVAGRK